VSAELLEQKRAALGSPDSEHAAHAPQSRPAIVQVEMPPDNSEEHAAEPSSSSPAEGIPAVASDSAPAATGHRQAATADSKPGAAGAGVSPQHADGHGQTAGSTLPFQQLCLTFKHGAPVL
jgi:hypothetical protein